MEYIVQPTGALSLLSQIEADMISSKTNGMFYDLFRKCSLAVLSTGIKTDNTDILLQLYKDFEINAIRNERGVKLELVNPPQTAFVDGKMIKNIQNNLYSVLRDIVQTKAVRDLLQNNYNEKKIPFGTQTTNEIFLLLRMAGALIPGDTPNTVVCWGGHSINAEEYEYARQVGKYLGLYKNNICTGCGPGIMEAPMEGANIGYSLQHFKKGRFIGLTEPSIIAAEPPNCMVNELIIMPDIEKRLESFVRLASCILVFPGGPGTAEELLYLLAIKLNKINKHEPMPVILTGPKGSEDYFKAINDFISTTLGEEATNLYEVIIDAPECVAKKVNCYMEKVMYHRNATSNSYCFNWTLTIPEELQRHFVVSHENMSKLNLHKGLEPEVLACNLRSAFSGIVSGNVKAEGMQEIEKHGPFILDGDKDIMTALDKLLCDFKDQKRFLLSDEDYKPCYRIKTQ